MKTVSGIVLGAILVLSTAANAQDQMQLATSSAADFHSADKELNATYQKVLKKYSGNSVFITKLRQSELAWIKFRDAFTDSVFPEAKTNPDMYGSAIDMCLSTIPAQQTVQRTSDLKKLLNGPTTVANGQEKLSQEASQVSKLYQAAMKIKHDDQPSFATKFKKAQDAWTAFSNADAEVWSAAARDADKDAMKLSRLYELNQVRAKSLNEWVKGIPEGDVCTGSRVVQD